MSENLLNNETSSAGYPFDRMETATEIVFGGRISGTLASATDEAWYRFTTTDTNAHLFGNMGTYEVNMFESSLMNLYFYDADGTLLEASENYQIPYYALDLAFNRTYYLCVKPHYAGGATYALDICTVNQHSLLQSKFSSAENLDISFYGTEVSGSMEAPFGPAWYKFYTTGFQNHNNNEPNEYYITAVGEQESITVLYDSDKKEIARHYNDGTAAGSRLTVALDANKYYYICIKAPGNIFAVFDLSVEYYIQPYPGTCREAAIKLTNGQNYNEEFFSYSEDKWFKFTATEHDGNIGGYTLSGIMSCDFSSTLFDSDGNEIQPVHVAVNQRDFCYWCTMSTNETYYLRVTSMSENGGSFYVNASETPSILNKGSSMADAITMYNIYTPVEGAITTPREEKWYKLTVDGDYDKIIVHSCDSEIELQAELYAADNELICSDTEEDSNVNFRMEPEVTPFYTYYLKVTGKDNATGSFKVRWSNGFYAEAINLPKDLPNLPVGTTLNLSSYVTPSDAEDLWIDWSVSGQEKHIATIDRYGIVKIKYPGIATIKAVSGDIRKDVSIKTYIAVERVSFVESSYEMHNGEEVYAELEVYPSTASSFGVVFSSSNPAVAEYDENRKTIKAKTPGTAIISVTANGITSSCTVVVKEKVVVSRYYNTSNPDDEANNELRIHFTHSGKVWRVVNHDTIFYVDPTTMDPNDIPDGGIPIEKMPPDNIDLARCYDNLYTGHDFENLENHDPVVKEYTDDEIKVLYALDPYGVADYVLRYSEYLAQTDSENDTIEKRVIAAMLEKDRCFKVIFGQDAKHYKRESNGRWYLDKYPENLADCYSDSESIFGMHMVWDEYLKNKLNKAVLGLALEAIFALSATNWALKILKTTKQVVSNVKKATFFAYTAISDSILTAATDLTVELCFEGTSLEWISDLYSLGGHINSFVSTINNSHNLYPDLFDYYIEELNYKVFIEAEDGTYSIEDIRGLIC